MTGRTHLALGILVGLAASHYFGATPENTLAITVAAAIGSLLPDIDHPQSIISGYIPGSGIVLNGILGVRHRGITHSLLFIVLFNFGVAAWLIVYKTPIAFSPIWLGFSLGMTSHLIADMLTPQGIPLLYPLRGNFKLAPGIILSIGHGLIESVVFVAAAAGIVYLLVLHGQRFV